MVFSELTGEVSIGVLLVFLVFWRRSRYIGSDQQGDIHNVLSTYLLQCFVSSIFDDIAKSMNKRANADVICNVAILYREWLMKSLKSSEQHLRLCVHFMTMSGNVIEFVNAYRCQDSITIESGYSWFAPRWKLLGQCKYLEAYHEQLDCLLCNNQDSRLEEVRRNRFVRTYHS